MDSVVKDSIPQDDFPTEKKEVTDVTAPQDDLEPSAEEENSPIEEVAAVIPNTDDPSIPVNTFRVWFMGTIFTLLLAFLNQFFFMRTTPITISLLTIQLISYPFGKFLARVLPVGPLNPGPFSLKEHVVVTVMANTANGTAYAVDIVLIQKIFYGQDFGFLYGFLLILTTQTVGYGFAGILRRFLVTPAAMIWPANLVNCVLFQTLHKDDNDFGNTWKISRFRFFCYMALASFIYYWGPGFFLTVLASISWLCWISPNNVKLAQLTGGQFGLGFGAISLDWATIGSYLQSPLVSPWWATANVLAGFILITWFYVPIAYYNNVWGAQNMPISNSKLYTVDGALYPWKKILNADMTFNESAYEIHGPLRLTSFFALTYGVGFAGFASILSYIALHNGPQIWKQYKASRDENEDIHAKLMRAYPEVPSWWYYLVFVAALVLSLVTVTVWDTKLPWWGLLLSILIAALFTLPVGIIQAVTNQQPGLNIITEFVIGYWLPGRPIANVCFKTYGYISMVQALFFTADLKLGHYMKIPPRFMFTIQMYGTLLNTLINLATANWLVNSVEGICTPQNELWGCSNSNVFFSASVIWGVIGPARMFGPSSIYNPLMYFFLIGFLLPVPFYFLSRAYPNSWVRFIHIPVILAATGNMPPAPAVEYPSFCFVGFFFMYYLRNYHRGWWAKFNYILSAALDSGTGISALVIFLLLQLDPSYIPSVANLLWWGNDLDACPFSTAAYSSGIDQRCIYGPFDTRACPPDS